MFRLWFKVIQICLRQLAKDGNDEYSTSVVSPSRGSPAAANALMSHPKVKSESDAPVYGAKHRYVPTSGRNTTVVDNVTFKLIESDI